jgi:hypothetical protein
MGLRTTAKQAMRRRLKLLVSVFNEPNSLKSPNFGPTPGAVGKA